MNGYCYCKWTLMSLFLSLSFASRSRRSSGLRSSMSRGAEENDQQISCFPQIERIIIFDAVPTTGLDCRPKPRHPFSRDCRDNRIINNYISLAKQKCPFVSFVLRVRRHSFSRLFVFLSGLQMLFIPTAQARFFFPVNIWPKRKAHNGLAAKRPLRFSLPLEEG